VVRRATGAAAHDASERRERCTPTPRPLLFWSGRSFKAKGLVKEGSFKAAEARYTSADEVDVKQLQRWLKESRDVQWDYKNIVKRKGRLERLK
jgi:hypothetical protein